MNCGILCKVCKKVNPYKNCSYVYYHEECCKDCLQECNKKISKHMIQDLAQICTDYLNQTGTIYVSYPLIPEFVLPSR